MNIIKLIALREYMENVRTKGFWLTILIVPLMIAGMIFIQITLQNATPTRYYMLIDQSGQYEAAVATAIEREHQRRILQEFVEYLLDHRLESDIELTGTNTGNAVDQMVDDVDADEVAALEQWLDNGGLDFALTMASPYLKTERPDFEIPEPQFIEAPLPATVDPTASAEEIVDALRPYLSGERQVEVNEETGVLFALILIPSEVNNDISRPGVPPNNVDASRGVQYWASNLTDSRLPDAIIRSINAEIREREYENLGVNTDLVNRVQRTRLPIAQLDPTAAAGEEAVSLADTFRQFAPIGFVYLMFISLMQSVQYLLSNTVEEKSNRIIEVLLASITADELMMGKLIGIGMAGLTTIGTWLLALIVFLNVYSTTETELINQMLEVIMGSELIPWFVFYYFAGYALYSSMFLAIGSLCNTLKEAQALMTPMIVIQVIPIAMMAFVVVDPNNTLVRVMSWIPLFTPYLMMNRAAADAPLVDVIGTTILLLISIVFVLWVCGKVFRQGVLRSGQPPRLMELIRLIRAKT